MTSLRKRFLVALSFPGTQRELVENVANQLGVEIGRDRVLYDRFYEAEFARPNLDTYLQGLYRDESELVVVFLCRSYAERDWPGLEWRAIRELIRKKEDSTIMLVQVDDGDVPGVFEIDGRLDARGRDACWVAERVLERLRGERSRAQPLPDAVTSQRVEIPPKERIPITIALVPATDYAIAGLEDQMVTATVRDQYGDVMPGVEVRFVNVGAEGDLTNVVGAEIAPAVTDVAGQATVEWSQSIGDWGFERIMAHVGGSRDRPLGASPPASGVSLLVWAYVDGTGQPGKLVSVRPGTQQVQIHAGYAPWSGLGIRVSLRPYDSVSALGGAVYSEAVGNFIWTRHHTWAEGEPFFIVAESADGWAPALVYAHA